MECVPSMGFILIGEDLLLFNCLLGCVASSSLLLLLGCSVGVESACTGIGLSITVTTSLLVLSIAFGVSPMRSALLILKFLDVVDLRGGRLRGLRCCASNLLSSSCTGFASLISISFFSIASRSSMGVGVVKVVIVVSVSVVMVVDVIIKLFFLASGLLGGTLLMGCICVLAPHPMLLVH